MIAIFLINLFEGHVNPDPTNKRQEEAVESVKVLGSFGQDS